jgi:hypothetical protein
MSRNGGSGSASRATGLALLLVLAGLVPVPLLVLSAFAPQNASRAEPRRPAAPASVAHEEADLQRLFLNPPDDSRIMMRWWWFGPSVTKPELERELRLMRDGGIGGVEVQPVYPVALDDAERGIRNLAYLSDEFIDALRFVAEKGSELGLRIDLTLGSGWPFGGPQLSISQAAGRLRVERVAVPEHSRRVKVPALSTGETLIAVFLAQPGDRSHAPGPVREVGEIESGAVRLPSGLEGPHELLFFIASRTGQMVKRAAVGAEGFVLDHYDRAATDHYLRSVGDRLKQAFSSHPPYAIFCDSLEVFASDWTADFLDEFQKRRGYDLKPHLPALAFGAGPETPALRHDWGQTLTELLDERFLAPVHEWARRWGTRFRAQAYGVPPATISSSAHLDLPEGEGAQWKSLRASRWASSASHLYAHPVTSSETWTWLHSPAFRATPLDVKAEADLHFLQGINQLIGHGWPYTAEKAEYPGWRFYAAGVFNEKNPWWIVMPDVARYLQRVSFMLRQGQPVNDVALYLPTSDAWARFVPGRVGSLIDALSERLGPDVVARLLEAGYNFDVFDDQVLRQIGHAERGALVLGPNRYRAVVLPGIERIPLDTLRTLEQFARGGGALVATRRLPQIAPGFLATEAEHREVREIVERLFRAPGGPARLIEDESSQLAQVMTGMLSPDLQLSPAAPDIGFVHRRSAAVDIYFVVNTSNVRQNVVATFPVADRGAEWWDPMSGRITPARPTSGLSPEQRIALDLEPYGSRILVFSARPTSGQPARRARTVPPPLDLSTGWRVSLGTAGAPVVWNRLRSWTEDEETRYFSGVATYERSVTVPRTLVDDGLAVSLDFGEGLAVSPTAGARMQAWLEGPVREAAVVFVNDQRAGAVWCPPYSVEVTGLLRRGENSIRILVANLAINHVAGRSLPDYRLLNLRYGVRFEPQDMDKVQPVPSGLLGPVRLVAVASGPARVR